MPLQIEKNDTEKGCLIHVRGEVDLYSSPELREALVGEWPTGLVLVCVDLSEVPYMDSSGVATLVEGLRAAKAQGATFALVSPSAQVLKVLQLARLDSVFEIRESM